MEKKRALSTAEVLRLVRTVPDGNFAGMAGELLEVHRIYNICGWPFEGLQGTLRIPRANGMTADHVPVIFLDSVYKELEESRPPQEGVFPQQVKPWTVMTTGRIQTMRNSREMYSLAFVMADFLRAVPYPEFQNDVVLEGVLACDPICRQTPRGRIISDFRLKVPKKLTGGVNHIPCICWENQAKKVACWHEGDRVALAGRFQDRGYFKSIQVGTEIQTMQKIAYEISASQIIRIAAPGAEGGSGE